MLFELARALRPLIYPLTAALHEARRMARPFHFEEGGTVPTEGDADGPNNKDDFVLPSDVRAEEMVSAIRDWLQAQRFSAPKRNSGAASSLKRTVDGRMFVPADLVFLLGDGAVDRGKQVMEKIVSDLRHRRVLSRLRRDICGAQSNHS